MDNPILCNLNNKFYSEIIPLGEECYTSMTIDKKFNGGIEYRLKSYPFDYVGHTFCKNIMDNLKNETPVKNIIIKKFGEKYFYYDLDYEFCYWHDTMHHSENEFTKQECEFFLQKYNTRYDRLFSKIKGNDSIVYLSVQHFNKIFKNCHDHYDDVFELYSLLNKKNPNILFVAIGYLDKNVIHNNFYHFEAKYVKCDSFEKSKKNFEIEIQLKIKNIFKKNKILC